MRTFTLAGWFVAHALWLGALIAGVTAWAMSVLRHRSPRVREGVALAALALMVIAPLLMTIAGVDIVSEWMRRPIIMSIDRAVPMPVYFAWRSELIPLEGALWITGVAVALARLGAAWRHARALRRSGVLCAGAAVEEDLAGLAARLSLATAVEVRRSPRAGVPMVLGWKHPLILLPPGAEAALRADQMRAILAHELAHVSRGDYLANVLQRIADALLFFHPGARWISRRIRVEREYCCDDIAIAVSGDRAVYARALAALEDTRSDCALAAAASSGTLIDRISRIAGRPAKALTMARGALVMAAATALAAVLAAALLALPQSLPIGTQLRRRSPSGVPPAASSQAGSPKRQAGGPR